MTPWEENIQSIESWLIGNAIINSVTKGDPNELDVIKATKFPVAHIIPESIILHEGYTEYTHTIWLLGKPHWEAVAELSLVAQQFMTALSRGSFTKLGYQIQDLPSADMMYDYGQNRLYGWSISVTIMGPNDIDNCG